MEIWDGEEQAIIENILGWSQAPQVLIGAGAISINTIITHFVTAGAGDAVTLADGKRGQIKLMKIKTITTGGDTTVVTPASFSQGTTITFNATSDIVTLVFTNSQWNWLGGHGAVIA